MESRLISRKVNYADDLKSELSKIEFESSFLSFFCAAEMGSFALQNDAGQKRSLKVEEALIMVLKVENTSLANRNFPEKKLEIFFWQ